MPKEQRDVRIFLDSRLHADYYMITHFSGVPMPIRQVIIIGDERLRQKAKKVNQFTPVLEQLVQDMLETMQHYDGVGLAAPQIGVMQRLFVAAIPITEDDDSEPHPQSGETYVLINPEVVRTASNIIEGEEGCLSIPNWRGLVERPEWVEVKAQDLSGRSFNVKVDDLLARIFQHEIDHLDGRLYLDHIKDGEKLWELMPEDDGDPEPLEV
jgi:peptide deformylase